MSAKHGNLSINSDNIFPMIKKLMAGPQLIAYFIQINYWMEKYQLSA